MEGCAFAASARICLYLCITLQLMITACSRSNQCVSHPLRLSCAGPELAPFATLYGGGEVLVNFTHWCPRSS